MVQERESYGQRKQRDAPGEVLSQRTIKAWAFGIILVAISSLWAMLYFFGNNNPASRNQLEVIRIASTIVLGTGGAAALLITARRQRFAELDGRERRITELQTKAADQLGHDKAAVRLAGLHSLERLAQDHPSHRQTIVDIICAYLRMPFVPAGSIAARPIAGSLHQRRTPTWMRPQTTINSDSPSKSDLRAEQQVRLTAQRILKQHLQPNCYNRHGKPPNPKFWPRMELDLSDATLIDFNLQNCAIESVNFSQARFMGIIADFDKCIFNYAEFDRAVFDTTSVPHFSNTWFNEYTSFSETHFNRGVVFAGAKFRGSLAYFGRTTFGGDAEFRGCDFHSFETVFSRIASTADASVKFRGVEFLHFTRFLNLNIAGSLEFEHATIRQYCTIRQHRHGRNLTLEGDARAELAQHGWGVTIDEDSMHTGERLLNFVRSDAIGPDEWTREHLYPQSK